MEFLRPSVVDESSMDQLRQSLDAWIDDPVELDAKLPLLLRELVTLEGDAVQRVSLEWLHSLLYGEQTHDLLRTKSEVLLPLWVDLVVHHATQGPTLAKYAILLLCSSLEWILLASSDVQLLGKVKSVVQTVLQLAFADDVHVSVSVAAIKFLQIFLVTHSAVGNEQEVKSVADLLPASSQKAYMSADEMKSECDRIWETILAELRNSWKEKSKGVQKVTALINILMPIAASRQQYAPAVLTLLLELPAQLARRLSWMENTRMKSIKTSLTAYVRSQPVDEETASTILTLLYDRFHAKIDVHQITQFLSSTKGMKVRLREKEKDRSQKSAPVHVEYTYAPEQHQESVLYGLQQFAQTVSDFPGVSLPIGFDVTKIDAKIVADIIVQSLSELPTDWDRSVANLKRYTDAYLATQTPLESITMVGQEQQKTTETKKKAEPKEFKLEPSEEQPSLPVLEGEDVDDETWEQVESKRESVLDAMWNVFEQILYQSPIGGQAEKEEEEETFNEVQEKFETSKKGGEASAELRDVIGLLDNGGASWMFKFITKQVELESRPKRKRKLEEDDEMDGDNDGMSVDVTESVEDEQPDPDEIYRRLSGYWKGSRSFWTVFLSRFVYQICEYPKELMSDENMESDTRFPTFAFDIKYELFIPFLLEDFSNRWDLAVRWLWEEWFHAEQQTDDIEKSAYTYWLGHLLDRMFAIANDALPGDSDTLFVPWLTSKNQNILFRKFLDRLPLLPRFLFEGVSEDQSNLPLPPSLEIVRQSGIDVQYPTPAILSTMLFDITLNRPLPTPLQKLKMILGIDVLYDALTNRPAYRSWLLKKFLQFSCDKIDVRRCETIRISTRWWTFGIGLREKELEKPNLEGLLACGEESIDPNKSRVESGGFFDGIQRTLYSRLEAHALKQLRFLDKDAPPEEFVEEQLPAQSSGPETMDVDDDESEKKDEIQKVSWTKASFSAVTDMYLVLCAQNPSLCTHFFDIYSELFSKNESDDKMNLLTDAFGVYVLSLGMPISDADKAPSPAIQLLDTFRQHCPIGCEKLVLKLLSALTVEKTPAVRPSKELGAFIIERLKSKAQQFIENPQFWALVLNSEGLTRADMMHIIFALADLLLGVEGDSDEIKAERESKRDMFLKTMKSFFALATVEPVTQANPYISTDTNAPLSPYDVFILFHIFELSPPVANLPVLSLRKQTEAIQLLTTSPEFSQFYNQRTVCFGLQAIIDKYGSRAPPLFMRSVLMTVYHFKESIYSFIVGNILTKCTQFKTLWIGAKMTKNETEYQRFDEEERRRAKALWSGWTRCLKNTTPQSFILMTQISRNHLTLVLQGMDAAFNQQFKEWVVSQPIPRARIHAMLGLIPKEETEEKTNE